MADSLETTVAASRRRSTRTAGSSPTSPTSSARRSPRSSPRRRCIEGAARRAAARRPARRPSCWSRDVRRLRTLVDDLMEISRFDAGAERPAVEPVDLGRVVTGAVAARLPEAAVDAARRPLVVGHRPAPARPDPRQPPRQRPRSRAGSARRGGPDAGRATAPWSSSRTGGRASRPTRCRTCSTGSTRPTRRGRRAAPGLGLAIAAEHAALLGGTLRARPRPGGGMVFALTLPVTGSLPAGDASDTAPADAGRAWNPHRGPGHERRRRPVTLIALFAVLVAGVPRPARRPPARSAAPAARPRHAGATGPTSRRTPRTWPRGPLTPAPTTAPATASRPTRRPAPPADPDPDADRPGAARRSSAPTSCSAASPATPASSRSCARSPRRRPSPRPRCASCSKGPQGAELEGSPGDVHGHSRGHHACSTSRSPTAPPP